MLAEIGAPSAIAGRTLRPASSTMRGSRGSPGDCGRGCVRAAAAPASRGDSCLLASEMIGQRSRSSNHACGPGQARLANRRSGKWQNESPQGCARRGLSVRGGGALGVGIASRGLNCNARSAPVFPELHHSLLSSFARPAKKSRRATLAVYSLLNPSSRSRAGSGSPSRQISQLHGLG
jgi:hypothetical protein